MSRSLDQLDDDALRLRAAPFLAGPVPAYGLRVDVASGVEALDDVASGLRRARFKTGRKALYRTARSVDDLDSEELATAVARAAGLNPSEVYRASDSELYTALPDEDILLSLDLPDLPDDELRAILDRFAVPAPADVALADWAQTALIDRTQAGRQLRAVDALTGTAARHPGEWAVDGDQLTPVGFPGAWRSAGVMPSDAEQSYLDAIRPAIAALRPAFDRRRRGLWYEQMTAMLGSV